ncbi:MAG: DUF4389 domain-containing protein [Actinomycetota bacterium]|nr:DUF4389 domain-containing protein [Actinomycetota bacterium]
MEPHPIRVVVTDDLRRSRLTVFFRLLLAIPHIVWLILWTIAIVIAAILNWFATLVLGRSPAALHSFAAAYVRYSVHVRAFLYLAANPFPGFLGKPGSYPIDVEIAPPAPQRRLVTLFRIVLVLPALMLSALISGSPGSFGGGRASSGGGSVSGGGGIAFFAAICGWFVSLIRARIPQGFRDLIAFGLRYDAQVTGYVLLLTDRYPSSNPLDPVPASPPPLGVRMHVKDDLRRSRLTVFFRLLLTMPHFVWLTLWAIPATLAILVNWIATLITGRPPAVLHRFLSAYLRYQTHVYAYLFLLANPFPGFVGKPRKFPVDLEIVGPDRQNRWITGFRLILAIPAFVFSVGFAIVSWVVAFFAWWVAMVLGRVPVGLRNLGLYALRYSQQVNGYVYILTDRYPYTGPIATDTHEPPVDEPAPALQTVQEPIPA